MDWQQKAFAIQSLANWQNFSIKMRGIDNWYVASSLDRKEGSCLSRGLTNGKTPEEAVNQYWDWATDPKFYLVINCYTDKRRAVKWNGFMWQDISEDQ